MISALASNSRTNIAAVFLSTVLQSAVYNMPRPCDSAAQQHAAVRGTLGTSFSAHTIVYTIYA